MTVFASPAEELAATQTAAEQLLQQIAASRAAATEHELARLEKLADACTRLAYPNSLPLAASVHNLVTWCDHLNEAEWKAKFMLALESYPLRAPWSHA